MSVEELFKEAISKDVRSLVLTDINNTSACLSFVREAPKYGIRPVLGVDFRNGIEQKFIGIARSNAGFEELNNYLSYFLHNEGTPVPDRARQLKSCYVVYPFSSFKGEELRDNEFLGVTVADLWKLERSAWKDKPEKLVVLHTASFQSKKAFNAHRLLRAIDNNTLLSKLPDSEQGAVEHQMLPCDELKEQYSRHPHIIRNTEQLIANCSISFDFGENAVPKNKRTYTGSTEKDYMLIRELCEEGMKERYGGDASPHIRRRLEKELEIIEQKGFFSYFLINWDILREARERGFFYVGRGSGANSIVAYLLKITDVDPIDLDLYFERFINLYRKNPPDFDIDFSWRDREEITTYIFEKFGWEHTALLATYSTFKQRAVIRELGKVFGLPPREIDKLQESPNPSQRNDKLSNLVLKYSRLIHGFPSHLSIHAGGILIAEAPMQAYTATSLPPKNYPLTHFSMLEAEDVGLYKFDILSQRGLGKIKETLSIVEYNRPEEPKIDIHDIDKFKKDEQVKYLLRNGKAIGCFYVESPAMRMLLKKLKADHYLGLVAASSIIRPGVAKSGMMREYILRFRIPEKRKEAHPVLWDIMPDTYGVMVYQEDVIKVAHYFADLTLGEADVLRRGMSGKYRSREEFKKVEQKFFTNCREKGYSEVLTKDVWRQIESFAGYAFSKGHSASYAVESYQSLYLKAHYPLEYMVAVLNNGGGFYRSELYVHEARMLGAIIEAPCVNKSDSFTVISGKTIFLGLVMIKEIEKESVTNEMVEERKKGGDFQSLEDFCERVNLPLEKLKLLIRAGAFRFTGASKKELLWKAHFLLTSGSQKVEANRHLFRPETVSYTLPELESYPHEDAFDEIELLGFPLSNVFDLLDTKVLDMSVGKLKKFLGETIVIHGYLIAIKRTSTSGGKQMNFGTFIDKEGYFIDTVHFPPSASKYPFRGTAIYKLTGKVVEEFSFYSLEVEKMEREPYKNQSVYH